MANSRYFKVFLLLVFLSSQSVAGDYPCIGIMNSEGKEIYLQIELACTDDEHKNGLMFRNSMPDNHGMLFVFKDENKRTFWMKNTYIPLSVAYISAKCIINEIYDMKPLDITRVYPSTFPAKYVLEVNKGWFSRNNIKPGCRIVLHGCLGQ